MEAKQIIVIESLDCSTMLCLLVFTYLSYCPFGFAQPMLFCLFDGLVAVVTLLLHLVLDNPTKKDVFPFVHR